MPLFSVIVTVYNLERYISQCLDSLVDQDFHDFEVLVVDNGSIDSSKAICQKYAERYPDIVRFISLDQPSIMHRGHKAGLDAARGTYIHIMDGDDYVRKGYLKDAAKIVSEKSPDVIIGHYSSFTEGNALPSRDAVLEKEMIDYRSEEEVIGYIRTIPAYHLAFWRYIFKRSLIKGGKLFNSRFEENTEFPLLDAIITFRVLLSASSYSLLEEPFYYYRQRVDSLTALNAKQILWHVQSFSEFLMLLHEGEIKGEKRNFVLSKIRHELKLILGQSDLWTQDIKDNIIMLLEKARVGMSSLCSENVNTNLQKFCKWIEEIEAINDVELTAFFEKERHSVIQNILVKSPENLFVFPCGQFARDVHRWMKQSGVQKINFFDNNPAMNGRVVQGSKCFTTDILSSFSDRKLQKTFVLIATIYEELDQLLVKQLKDLGLQEENLIICWP